MVEYFVSHVDLDRAEAGGGCAAAEGFLARCLAEGDVKGFCVVGIGAKGIAVFSLDFIVGEVVLGKAKEAHGW